MTENEPHASQPAPAIPPASSGDGPVSASGRKRLSRTSRWLLWTGALLLLFLAALAAVATILLHRAAPMLRASLIDTLQKRFHAKVELDSLSASVLDGFSVEGRGLRIWLPAEATIPGQAAASNQEPWRAQPWILVDKLKFHASWRISPGKPIEVSVIRVEGARVLLPPKEDRPQFSPATPENTPPQPQPSGAKGFFQMPRIQVHRIECEKAELILERKFDPAHPGKEPLAFELKKISLTPDGKGGPVAFSVDMVNAKPIGAIHSTGHFGPLGSGIPTDPGSMPVEGDYTFDHADLSTIKGIAGILASTGHYAGTLRHIEVDGQTETPDFRLERVRKGTGLPLNTRFHAIVDGTNGNTDLEPVDATLGHTHFVARGQVVRAGDIVPGAKGHDITLNVVLDRGRIDDILAIAADAEMPFMAGNLTLHTTFHLPPNPGDEKLTVFDRLQLDGQFHLSQARFNNPSMQGKIEQLSLRGQGKPDELKATDPTSILSEMQGHFKLSGGSLQLPDLDYEVPGAKILIHGAYGLQGGTLNFDGDAKLDAELSAVVGGWKGILLKPMDRYLKKNGAGTDVPIHVQGTRKDPKVGLDFGRLGKTDKSAAPESQ